MSIYHHNVERTHLPCKIHPIYHLRFLKTIGSEHLFFSSTPLLDSSKHEDAEKRLEFSYLRCCDLSTSSSNHDVDSIIVNMCKTLVYDDLSVNEVETLQVVEAP